jgi:gas vesicle protein
LKAGSLASTLTIDRLSRLNKLFWIEWKEDLSMAENGSDFGTWVGGFILGIVTGAAVALLMAPQSGEETRDMLQEKGQTLKEKAADTVQEARYQAKDVASKARERISSLQDRGQDIMDQGSRAMHDTARDVRNAADDMTQSG